MTAIKLARSITILMSIFIAACRSESPADPVCRIDSEHKDNISANAKCIVRVGDLLLAITQKGNKTLEIPSGLNQETESAQCAAHRGTWHSTGFNVEVGQYLGSDEQATRFYLCGLDTGFGSEVTTYPVPRWLEEKTAAIQLVDPFSTQDKNWTQPKQLIFIRDMFNKASH